jgi:hypothetical protein
VDLALLPKGISFDPRTYENDDICHTNILKISKKQAREIAKNVPMPDVQICDPAGVRQVTIDDILSQRRVGHSSPP